LKYGRVARLLRDVADAFKHHRPHLCVLKNIVRIDLIDLMVESPHQDIELMRPKLGDNLCPFQKFHRAQIGTVRLFQRRKLCQFADREHDDERDELLGGGA
jgi:hypothetical protein